MTSLRRSAIGMALSASLVVATLLASAAAMSAPAMAGRALPVSDETQALFRRVLTRPGALLHEARDGDATQPLAPFQVYYVYAQDADWTEVGTLVEGETAGFIPTAKVLDWNTSIVATFNNRVANDRERMMIFGSREKLIELLRAENVTGAAEAYRAAAMDGAPLASSGVVSIEPEEYIDLRERLYILPILKAEDVSLPGRNRGKVLEIASMSARDEAGSGGDDALKDFPVEIAFVIDSTRSMQPYIDEVRDAVAGFAAEIGDGPVRDRLSFALVEYRDSIELVPELDFVAETRLDFGPDATAEAFLEAIGAVQATEVSSQGFNEDALAGLHKAITELSWSEERGAKLIFLVSDAGPRFENLTIADMMEQEIHALAAEKEIAISAWHLRTSDGSFDHASAEDAYRELSSFGGIDAYNAVELGDANAFRAMLDQQVDIFGQILQGAQEGLRADEIEEIDRDSAAYGLGHAMQLAFLGTARGAQAPDVFNGWMLREDIPRFDTPGLDIRIMLTRNQLSTLSTVVETMIDELDASILDPTTFFDRLQTALALLAQDTSRIAEADLEVLGDAVGNLLSDLPYQSDIMDMTRSDWIAEGGPGQLALNQRLRSKLRAYRDIYADADLWTPLDEAAPPGEHVTLVSLDLMP